MLTPRQILVALAIGTVFWAVAAFFVRVFGAPLFVDGSAGLVILFAASVPFAWASMEVCARLGRFSGADLVPALVTMTVVAVVLDGVALVWAPGLYRLPRPTLVLAAAWLLYGVGFILAFGLWKASRQLRAAA